MWHLLKQKKSWELASRMRAKKLQPKAKKFVMSLQNSAEVPHPAASELSEGESEICQRIVSAIKMPCKRRSSFFFLTDMFLLFESIIIQ